MVQAVAKTGAEEFLEPMPSQVIKARQDLTKILQQKAGGANSIYEHIVAVIDRIVQSCPDQAIERFEEISYLIKNSGDVELEEFVRCKDIRGHSQHDDATAKGTNEAIAKLREMFASSAQAVADGGEEEGGGGGPVLGLV